MSPSEPDRVPAEVLAIAVALAVAWQQPPPEEDARRPQAPAWRWAGRRWERPASHRWS